MHDTDLTQIPKGKKEEPVINRDPITMLENKGNSDKNT
jgi:hypothetical protein